MDDTESDREYEYGISLIPNRQVVEEVRALSQVKDAELLKAANDLVSKVHLSAEFAPACVRIHVEKRLPKTDFSASPWEQLNRSSKYGQQKLRAVFTVARRWGEALVGHYRFGSKPRTYCNELRAASNRVGSWGDAVEKLNHLICTRAQSRDKRIPAVRDDANPIEQMDLKNLQPTTRTDYTVPKGFGKDAGGLVVRDGYAISNTASAPAGWQTPNSSGEVDSGMMFEYHCIGRLLTTDSIRR